MAQSQLILVRASVELSLMSRTTYRFRAFLSMIDDASEDLHAARVLQCYFDVCIVQGFLGQDQVKRRNATGPLPVCIKADHEQCQ